MFTNPEPDPELKDQFRHTVLIANIFVLMRDGGLNEAVWIFSIRYWAISFVIPWQLKSKDTPKNFLIFQSTLFIVGLILNFLAPAGYAYYGIKVNDTLTLEDLQLMEETYQKYKSGFFIFKYSVTALQVISGLFMLWAIKRLWSSIKGTPEFTGLFDQKMVVTHFIAFVAYLLSISIYNIIYLLFSNIDQSDEKKSERSANIDYTMWAISQILLFLVQLVIIYIIWGLSKDEWIQFDHADTEVEYQGDDGATYDD